MWPTKVKAWSRDVLGNAKSLGKNGIEVSYQPEPGCPPAQGVCEPEGFTAVR